MTATESLASRLSQELSAKDASVKSSQAERDAKINETLASLRTVESGEVAQVVMKYMGDNPDQFSGSNYYDIIRVPVKSDISCTWDCSVSVHICAEGLYLKKVSGLSQKRTDLYNLESDLGKKILFENPDLASKVQQALDTYAEQKVSAAEE